MPFCNRKEGEKNTDKKKDGGDDIPATISLRYAIFWNLPL